MEMKENLKTERVRIGEACALLGMNQNAVHERMRRGILPIGHAISPKENGTTRWQFVILRPMLNAYLGYGKGDM